MQSYHLLTNRKGMKLLQLELACKNQWKFLFSFLAICLHIVLISELSESRFKTSQNFSKYANTVEDQRKCVSFTAKHLLQKALAGISIIVKDTILLCTILLPCCPNMYTTSNQPLKQKNLGRFCFQRCCHRRK